MILAQIAERLAIEVMGWNRCRNQWFDSNGSWVADCDLRVSTNLLWNPANNIDQAFLVQAEIERKGLTDRYSHYLSLETGALQGTFFRADSDIPTIPWSAVYPLINATARQRCLAAIKTLPLQATTP